MATKQSDDINLSIIMSFHLVSYDRLSKKPLLFKSFTGLKVKEFDDIYDKEIIKRYHNYEIKRLSKRKDNRERIYLLQDRSFQIRCKKQISNAFSILSSLHNLHSHWLFV